MSEGVSAFPAGWADWDHIPHFNGLMRIWDLPVSRLSGTESPSLECHEAAAVKAKLDCSPVLLPLVSSMKSKA
jgi:hypothetical protein